MITMTKAKTEMEKVLSHLKSLFKGVSAGKADPELLNTIKVDYYGSKTPINQLSIISIVDFQTLQVQPYDPQIINSIAKTLSQSSLNFKVEKTKTTLLLKLPQISGDTRKKLVKHVEQLTEQQKISLRKVRQHLRKDLNNSDFSKDEKKGLEKKIDIMAKEFTLKIDQLADKKKKDLLTK
jgi:ribosome recycling factor